MSRRISHNILYLDLEDLDPQNSTLFIHSPSEASYLYFSVPFRDVHFLVVQISVVPFCLAGHRDQVFYYARGAYALCCSSIEPRCFIPTVCAAAQTVYEFCVRNHYWNFRTSSCWEQMEFGSETTSPNEICLQKSLHYLEHLASGNGSVTTAILVPTPNQHYPDSVMDDSQAPEIAPCQSAAPSRSSSRQPPQRRKRLPGRWSRKNSQYGLDQHEQSANAGQSTAANGPDAAIQVADQFLASIPNIDASRLAAASFGLPIEVASWRILDRSSEENAISNSDQHEQPQQPEQQYALKAWELCSAVARQANGYFGHARFVRFISLCFFLIWEAFSSKSGKASAREVNLRMREAGFEGTSRTLKSLRDETIFINQLVSSAEQMHGAEVASKLVYCIFTGSNYHYIRTVCRFGGLKRLAAVEHICKKFAVVVPDDWPLLTTRPQNIIKQHLPNLDIDTINVAIRYEPLAFSNQCKNENGAAESEEALDAAGGLWRSSFSFDPVPGGVGEAIGIGVPPSWDSGLSDSSQSAPASSAASLVDGLWDLELTGSPLAGLATQLDEWYANL